MNAPDSSLVANVAWRLSDITGSDDGASIYPLLDDAAARAEVLQRFRGRLGLLSAGEMATFWSEVEDTSELLARVGNFAQLRFATDTANPANGALMMAVQERSTAIGTTIVWVELEWAALDDAFVESVLASEHLARWRHNLRVLRLNRPHLLTEPEEKILAEKALTGASAWSRLFDEQLSGLRVTLASGELGTSIAFEEAFSRLQSPDRRRTRTRTSYARLHLQHPPGG